MHIGNYWYTLHFGIIGESFYPFDYIFRIIHHAKNTHCNYNTVVKMKVMIKIKGYMYCIICTVLSFLAVSWFYVHCISIVHLQLIEESYMICLSFLSKKQCIIFMVLRSRAGLSSMKNRLLVAMSAFDIIGSIGYALSTTPIPYGSNCTYGAMGNDATCTLQGSMISLGLVVPCYNAMLCIYFLMVIKHNIREDVLETYERTMHSVAIVPVVFVTIVAVALGLFNNYSLFCWLNEKGRYEINTDTTTSEEEDHGSNSRQNLEGTILVVLLIFTVTYGVLVVGIISYCMKKIYEFVKHREDRMNRYNRISQNSSNVDINGADSLRSPRSATTTTGSLTVRRRRRSRLSDSVHDTKVQAYLYVCSFLLTYVTVAALMIFDVFFDTPLPYPFMIVQAIFTPLQVSSTLNFFESMFVHFSSFKSSSY